MRPAGYREVSVSVFADTSTLFALRLIRSKSDRDYIEREVKI